MKLFLRWLKFVTMYIAAFLMLILLGVGLEYLSSIVDQLWEPAIGGVHVVGMVLLVSTIIGLSLWLAILTGDDK